MMIPITIIAYGILGVFGIFTIVFLILMAQATNKADREGKALMALAGFISTGMYLFPHSGNLVSFIVYYAIFLIVLAILFLIFRKSEKQPARRHQEQRNHLSFN